MGNALIRYHWVYRDFLRVAQDTPESEWTDRVWDQYIDRHYGLLNRLYFHPKGVDDPRQRLIQLGRNRFRPLAEQIGSPASFEQALTSMWADVLRRLRYQGPTYHVFVVVGLDTTNIYSLTLDGQPVTVLCLEAVDAHRAGLQRLIAHESHHWARQSALPSVPTTGGERLVSEGLAAVFSEEIDPGRHPASYCYVPKDTVEWVANHRDALQQWVAALEGHGLIEPLFSRTYRGSELIPGMPRRAGYVYGYFTCRQALDRETGHLSAAEMVAAPWQKVLSLAAGRAHR